MFASGDLAHWLIVKKEEIIGSDGEKWYSNQAIPVLMSSSSCKSYAARWFRRSGVRFDLWVSIKDYFPQKENMMVYGGKSDTSHAQILKTSGGMDVYIRNIL